VRRKISVSRSRCPSVSGGSAPTTAAGCRIDPGGMQDLPHRRAGDRMAGPDELALHTPVTPPRIVRRHADHELPDRGCRGRPVGTPPVRIVPFACAQSPVPGEQRRRGHREHRTLSPAADQPRQCRQPQPVARLVADPADLAAQYGVLVPEHQDLGIPWTPHAGQAPSDSRADSARPGRRPKRSLSDDANPASCPSQIQ